MKHRKMNLLMTIVVFLCCGLCKDLAVLSSLSFWIDFNASFGLFNQERGPVTFSNYCYFSVFGRNDTDDEGANGKERWSLGFLFATAG